MFDDIPPRKKGSFKSDWIKKRRERKNQNPTDVPTPGIVVDGDTGKKGYVYRQMELPREKITPEWEQGIRKRIHPHVTIELAGLEDVERVTDIHNRAFLTAPDPYAPITESDIRRLILCPRTLVIIGLIWGAQDCGFIILNFEEHCSEEEINRIDTLARTGIRAKNLPEEEYECAFISGLGVLPQWQRRGVGTTLGIKSWDIVKEYDVERLACEVYEGNAASYNLIVSMGFEEVGRVVYWADGRMQPLRRL
ncbi:MAG: GNAT family N-acetyltransferase [Promethearchaeota archaeon]